MAGTPWDVVATSSLSGSPGQTPNDPWAVTGTTTPTPPPPTALDTAEHVGEDVLGVPEAIGTGLLNTPHAFLSGLWDLSQRLSGNAGAPPPAWIQKLQALPTAPTQRLMGDIDRSAPGQLVDEGAAKVEGAAQPWLANHPVVNDVLHQTGSVAGDVANVVGAAAPAAEGFNVVNNARQAISAALEQMRNAPLRDTPEDLNTALDRVGYRQIPSKAPNAGMPSKLVGMTVGEGPLAQRQTLTNQEVTNALAGHEGGVPAEQPVTHATLVQAANNGPAKVYDAAEAALPPKVAADDGLTSDIHAIGDTVSQLPRSPDVEALKQWMLEQPNATRQQLFANIQEARERASRFLASEQPDHEAIGKAYLGLANAYENFVGRLLNHPGSPVSLSQWQDARTAFAKNYAVRAALRTPEATSVDAAAIARQAKNNPDQLTGGLRLIAAQHGRAPLSTGYGPQTIADSGIGRSGDLPGIMSRDAVSGGLAALFAHHFGLPEATGFGLGMGASYAGMLGLRRMLAGDPEAAAAMARSAVTDPNMRAFFARPGEFDPEPGFGRGPPRIAGLLPSPAMVNAGGGATTGLTLADELGLTPDVLRAGAGHPGAPAVPTPSPSPLEGDMVPSREPQEIPSTELWYSQPHTELHPTAQITTAEGAPAAGEGDQGGIPLYELLSHGLEPPPPAGLSVGPMGGPGGPGGPGSGGVPFHVDPGHAAGDLELAPEGSASPRPLHDDLAGVMSQGVPDGITTRTAPQPAVTHEVDEDTGSHTVTSPNGVSHGQESGPYLIQKRSDTFGESNQGKGEGIARAIRLVEEAEHRGLTYGSDVSVSKKMAQVYDALKRRGYVVERNPAATVNPNTGNWVSPDPRVPVFTVRTPLGVALGDK